MNVRLLLKDDDGVTVAVPLTNDVGVKSGIQRYSYPARLSEAIEMLNDPKNADKVSTIHSIEGTFMVTRSISEIFAKAVEAKNSNRIVVDLTNDSGIHAVAAKADQLKASGSRLFARKLR
jgi:hypothetical protein